MSNQQIPSFTPASKKFDAQGLVLHYLDWGNEHLPTLMLLHGIQDHARSWDVVAEALRDDWHVIALDMRGHGDSQWSPDGAYLANYMLMDLVELVENLGADAVTLVAHSFGGNAAARFAALYPDKVSKLVLIDAMGPPKFAEEMWEKTGAVSRTRDWLEKRRSARTRQKQMSSIDDAAARLRRGNALLSEEMSYHLARHGVHEDNGGYFWKHDPILGNFMPEDFAVPLSDFWKEITAPTLLCWGVKSWTSNPGIDGDADFFCNVTTAVFDDAGHWLHHDQCPAFVSELQGFLKDDYLCSK